MQFYKNGEGVFLIDLQLAYIINLLSFMQRVLFVIYVKETALWLHNLLVNNRTYINP